MTKLEINIRENNGATKESAPYIGHAISKGSKNFIALTEEAAALCGLPAIQVEAILRGAFAEFAALEKDGAVRINFDGGSVSQVIRGTFISSDAAFDEKRNSLELAWHLSEDVRHHLVNETPHIVSELTSTKVRLDTVADEDNLSCFGHFDTGTVVLDLSFYYITDFFRSCTHFFITSFLPKFKELTFCFCCDILLAR